MSAGNVLNFGADPLGNSDSYPAFQAAVDSPHAVEVPPGYFYLSQPVVFTKPKIVKMTQPLLEPFDIDPLRRPHRGPGPNVPESHSRLWTDQNINFFEIRSPQVFIEGGCFDAQKVTGWNKAALYYAGDAKDHNNRVNGWGGGAKNFMVIGSYLDMVLNSNEGGYGVYFDFDGFTTHGAYWTHMEFDGVVRGVRCGWYSTPRNPQYSHWANSTKVNLECDYSKQAVVNHSFTGLDVSLKSQARHVFSTEGEAEASPWVYSSSAIRLRDPEFWDLDDTQDAYTGCWKNRYSVELTAADNIVDDTFATTFARAKYIAGTKPRYTLDGARGFIPRQSEGQAVFIPDLHDALHAHFLSATKTTKAYKGRNDLAGLISPSDGPESQDITLQTPENLWKWNKTFAKYHWNQQACDDNDYVELVVDCAPVVIRNLWLTLSDGKLSPRKLQVILEDEAGSVFHNETRELSPVGVTSSEVRTEHFSPHWTRFVRMIIRFIGCNQPGGFIPHYVAGSDSRHKYQHPLVHV